MRIGTRGSDLALAQARQVAARLGALGHDAEIVVITTTGDRREIPRDPAAVGKALWTREIEEALARGDVDLAVHSLKDLPAELPSGLSLGAVLEREDPADVLVSRGAPRTIGELPDVARVGTGSVRRQAALRRARPDLDVVELKGNVPTRLARLESGDFDAVVLAAAGINRLGLNPAGLHRLGSDEMAPALCQGIVGVEVRQEEVGTDWVQALTDPATLVAARAERALLAELGVGCGAPVGGLATVDGGEVTLMGEVASPDGKQRVRVTLSGPSAGAAEVGRSVGRRLDEGEGRDLLASLRG